MLTIKICIENFVIDNAVLGLATEKVDNDALVSNQGGSVRNFTVQNSTIYGNAMAKYFVRASGNDFKKAGYADATVTYNNNTFYNVIKTDGQWGNNMRYNNNYSLITVNFNKNIFVDCGTGEILRRLFNKNFSDFKEGSSMADNVYNVNGAVVSQGNYGNGSDIEGIITFEDAAAGKFGLDATALDATIATAEGLLEGKDATVADSPEKTLSDAIAAAKAAKAAAKTQAEIDAANTALQNAIEAYKTATGINAISVDGVSGDIFSDGKPVYNLSGQRVFKGYKGIVIKNGKKVVIK